eukprot:Sspe_Gene.31008::Locus_15315_Transcript_2_5_Confidence_0.636_Length_459::g.31008::m.31008
MVARAKAEQVMMQVCDRNKDGKLGRDDLEKLFDANMEVINRKLGPGGFAPGLVGFGTFGLGALYAPGRNGCQPAPPQVRDSRLCSASSDCLKDEGIFSTSTFYTHTHRPTPPPPLPPLPLLNLPSSPLHVPPDFALLRKRGREGNGKGGGGGG